MRGIESSDFYSGGRWRNGDRGAGEGSRRAQIPLGSRVRGSGLFGILQVREASGCRTSVGGHAALEDLLHPHGHVRHVLGYGLNPLHQPDRLDPDHTTQQKGFHDKHLVMTWMVFPQPAGKRSFLVHCSFSFSCILFPADANSLELEAGNWNRSCLKTLTGHSFVRIKK